MSLSAVVSDLISPTISTFLAPFQAAWEDLNSISLSDKPESYEHFLRVMGRTALAAAIFFAHGVAWHYSKKDYTSVGCMVVSSLIYTAGNYISPKSNYIGSSAWLLFNGVKSLLQNKDCVAVVGLAFIQIQKCAHKTSSNPGNFAKWLASWHAYFKPAQRPQNSTNGQSH